MENVLKVYDHSRSYSTAMLSHCSNVEDFVCAIGAGWASSASFNATWSCAPL